MNPRVEQIVAGWLCSWVDLVRAHSALVLAVILALTSWIGVYTKDNLGVNADMDAMISEELPHRILEMEYERSFPVLSRNIVIVIDGPTPERARDAAGALAERMKGAPDLFRGVYLPQDEFFEEHALLYMGTDDLEDFADRLARVQPYLAGLAADGTLRGLSNLLVRGVAAVREEDVAGEQLVPMMDRFRAAITAWLEGKRYDVSWAEVVAGRELPIDARRRLILAQPVLDFTEVLAGGASLEAVRRYTDELGLDDDEGVRVRITGDVALSYEEMQLVQRQAALAGVFSFVLVGVLLAFAMRSVRLIVATLVTLVFGLVWTAGFAALTIGHLNLVSVSFAVLFIGLSVDFSIHLCMRYQELVALGRVHEDALRETAGGVGTSVVLCAFTTAIGFYAFAPTDFGGVAELGLIAGSGMFISMVLTFTSLPALMSIGRRAGASPARSPLASASLPAFPMRYPRAVGACALALGVGAVLLLPEVRFEGNPIRLRDPSAESVRTFEELLADGGTSPWTLDVVVPDLEAAERVSERLSALDEVEHAVTVSDFVPEDQDEKLAIMEDVALFLAPPPAPDGSVPPPGADEQVAPFASSAPSSSA